ncbi:hypothetical protein LTR86_003765 [Recurvomyces mirabilis]|nr:hypothetical protein LTR86_003765 [Recurvomyces mirabilis]
MTRDRLLPSVSTKDRMLWPFQECKIRDPRLWNIAVDQYYERNTFYANTMDLTGLPGRSGQATLLDVRSERRRIRDLILNVPLCHNVLIDSDTAQFGAPHLKLIRGLMDGYSNLRTLTVRVEHPRLPSCFTPHDRSLGVFWLMNPRNVLQRKMRALQQFLRQLVAAVRALEGRYLKSRFVELNQLADVDLDGYIWAEDFTDIEPTGDDGLLLWRLLDFPMGRVRLCCRGPKSRSVE